MKNMKVREHDSSKNLGLKDKKYILSHDDDTGMLFVDIVKDFDEYKLSDHLDEVFGHWEDGRFVFSCILDNEKSAYTTEGRLLIFEGHLRNSVLAMLRAERKVKEDDLKVGLKEVYKSKDPAFNKVVEDKNLYEFIVKDGKFVEYKHGFDYRSLSKYKKNN